MSEQQQQPEMPEGLEEMFSKMMAGQKQFTKEEIDAARGKYMSALLRSIGSAMFGIAPDVSGEAVDDFVTLVNTDAFSLEEIKAAAVKIVGEETRVVNKFMGIISRMLNFLAQDHIRENVEVINQFDIAEHTVQLTNMFAELETKGDVDYEKEVRIISAGLYKKISIDFATKNLTAYANSILGLQVVGAPRSEDDIKEFVEKALKLIRGEDKNITTTRDLLALISNFFFDRSYAVLAEDAKAAGNNDDFVAYSIMGVMGDICNWCGNMLQDTNFVVKFFDGSEIEDNAGVNGFRARLVQVATAPDVEIAAEELMPEGGTMVDGAETVQ